MKNILVAASGLMLSFNLLAGDNSSGGPQMPEYSQRVMELRTLLDSHLLMEKIGLNHKITQIEFLKKESGVSTFEVATKNCVVTAFVKTTSVQSGPVFIPKMTVESINGNCH